LGIQRHISTHWHHRLLLMMMIDLAFCVPGMTDITIVYGCAKPDNLLLLPAACSTCWLQATALPQVARLALFLAGCC
jgi:hypothetical protein